MANARRQRQLLAELQEILNSFIISRQELIRFLHETAVKLDKHHNNVKITKVVTGSTGIVGTVIGLVGSGISLVGFLSAVPTGGLSLTLTVGGGALGAISGVAHLVSGGVEPILNKFYIEKLNKLSQADERSCLRLNGYLENRVRELRDNAFDRNIFADAGFDITKEILSLASLGCSIIRVTRVASTAARSIQVFGTVIGERKRTISFTV
jgi:hypothetical protein